MREQKTCDAALLKNLEDAGCSETIIERVLACCGESGEKRYDRQLQILCRYRCQLLEKVHEEQKKLDCLDYLIYSMKKEKKETDYDLQEF